MQLNDLFSIFKSANCIKLYAKVLAENDNSKNQFYLGSDFKAVNIIPHQQIDTSENRPKAKVIFYWIDENNKQYIAPDAQLIFYPKYPEVRLSSLLNRCKKAPSKILRYRLSNRVLFLGIKDDDSIIGYVANYDDPISSEFRNRASSFKDTAGVFTNLTDQIKQKDSKSELLGILKKIHTKGWIESKRLDSTGSVKNCHAPNCGGYTLEAELGVTPNGRAEPDYLGWEIKQHSVPSFEKINSSIITLMTPEPTGGYYKDEGVVKFISKYGYPDKLKRKNRFNFGGVHRFGLKHATTDLRLDLIGYNSKKKSIDDFKNGGIALISDNDDIAALWHFQNLMEHWKKKHNKAAYIPSKLKKLRTGHQYYCYGSVIRLCQQTDFLNLLKAIKEKKVYYDPGIKLEFSKEGKPVTKRRSQFRIKSGDIPLLYDSVIFHDLVK